MASLQLRRASVAQVLLALVALFSVSSSSNESSVAAMKFQKRMDDASMGVESDDEDANEAA